MTVLLGISGSTRNESWNRAPLHVAAELVPPAARLEIRDLHEVPNYNQHRDDELGGTNTPEAVLVLRRRIEHADGLLLSSPEYNRSFTGVLKNALDLCSRPAVRSIPAGKPPFPLAPRAVPPGPGRAQLHLRQVLSTKTPVLIECLQVPNAARTFRRRGSACDSGDPCTAAKLLNELATVAA